MTRHLMFGVLLVVFAETRAHATAEICGDGIDNNGNGLTDEGCYPTITTGVCESPLSCGDTGMVSWSTGSLHYDLPPDVSPKVPFGPGIGFRRFYTSQYAPTTNPTTVNHTPLGPRWQHTYLTFLYKNTGVSPNQLVIHTSQGQDVLTKRSGSTGDGWDIYAVANPFGYHVSFIHQRSTAPFDYQIRLLTGETIVYNSSGQLAEIWDTLPTPNKVLVTWTSTSNGNVSTVTDAQAKRRLLFNYTSNLLTSMNYQINISGTWTTEHTTTYGYTTGNLTSVTIGSQLAQTNNYTSNYLTSIVDGASNQIAAFSYSSTITGQVNRVDSSRGSLGFDFNATRTSCTGTGKTALYFNKANTTSCSTDTDCGTGAMCGGKTGAGATGSCFKAARCLTISNPSSPSEDVVTTVTPIGAGGGTCSGACTDVASYSWFTGGASPPTALDLQATGDALGNYTTATYTNGLPTKIVYGDNDSDPSSGGARSVYMFYDATYPGKLSEVRRASDLSTAACDATHNTGCAQTLFTYYNDGVHNGLLNTTVQAGYTETSGADIVNYSYTTTNTYDTVGRLTGTTVTQGSATFSKSSMTYWTSSDPLKDQFLDQSSVFTKDVSTSLPAEVIAYDFWGNATAIKDPNNNMTCRIFDPSRNYMTQSRQAMAGQTDCTSVNAADLTTNWLRDSAVRLSKLTRPDGSCLFYEYDTRGRLARTKRRDDCNASSAGDRQEYTYDNDGLVTEIDTYDASSTLTNKQPFAYFASRKLQQIINPVDTSKFTGMVVDDAGRLTEVDGAGSLSKTVNHYNADNRVISIDRFKDTSTYDSWTVGYDWSADQSSYTDGDSKQVKSVRDDLGRVVELRSPDLPYSPNVQAYDAANRLIAIWEASAGGTGIAKFHNFTFDLVGRQIAADYDGKCIPASAPEIQRSFDALPSGVSCPAGATCSNLAGRLAWVKTSLYCATSSVDGSFDQTTFYSYDAAGRMIEEYIIDDSTPTPRIADHRYQWTKNGALTQVTTPSSNVVGWNYGSTASNSDTDLISGMYRTNTSTPIVDTVLWNPYGPLKQYNQENTTSTVLERTRITRNLAYRITGLYVENQTGTTVLHQVLISEDAKGRVTKRDYWPNSYGVQDSSIFYDEQDRVVCEAATLTASCPASGNKNQHSLSPPFTHAGDWKRILHPIPGSTGVINDFNTSGTTYGTSHQVTEVSQTDGTPAFGNTDIAYNHYGDRSQDRHDGGLTNDLRSYGYDARHNVTIVEGYYYVAGAWHQYVVQSLFDAKNRRVSKMFIDLTSLKAAQWFFYYDPLDRLTEVRYTPDTSVATTYSLFQLLWLKGRLVAYWQVDYPSVTTSKRYVGTDESGRPIDMICWSVGNCPRVWGINPSAWGLDTNVVGPTVFQPILFAGQYQDVETAAWENDGVTIHRPGVALNGARTYDPFTGGYLQLDPLADQTWSSYVYARSDPVGRQDRYGKFDDIGEDICAPENIGEEGSEYCGLGLGFDGGGGGMYMDPPGWWCRLLHLPWCSGGGNTGGGGGPGGGASGGGGAGSGGGPPPPPPPPDYVGFFTCTGTCTSYCKNIGSPWVVTPLPFEVSTPGTATLAAELFDTKCAESARKRCEAFSQKGFGVAIKECVTTGPGLDPRGRQSGTIK